MILIEYDEECAIQINAMISRKDFLLAYKTSILWMKVNVAVYLPLAFIMLLWSQKFLFGVVAFLVVPALMCLWIYIVNLFQCWLGWDKWWKLLITIGIAFALGVVMNLNYAASDAVASTAFVFATVLDASPVTWVVLLFIGPWYWIHLPFHIGYCLIRALYVGLMLWLTASRQRGKTLSEGKSDSTEADR